MNHLQTLYLKEIRGERDTLVGYAVIIGLAAVFLSVMTHWWSEGSATMVASIALGWLPLWLIYASFDLLAREWTEKSISLLSGLPVPSWQVLAAKVLSIWTIYLAHALLLLALYAITGFIDLGGNALQLLLPQGIVILPLMAPLLTPIAFAVYLSGVSFNRAANVIRVLAAAAAALAVTGLSIALSFFLKLIDVFIIWPGQIVTEEGIVDFFVSGVSIELSIPISIFIVGTLCFLISVRLFDRSIWQ